MSTLKTIGFPRMMKEPAEKRVYLPGFIQELTGLGLSVYVEEGYGSRSGYSFDDYKQGNERVRRCTRRDAFSKDIVMVLRSPTSDELRMIPGGSCLISMLHFPTRPGRVNLLKQLKIHAISVDSIVNDNNLRLVENMKAVAWNGIEAAFNVLEEIWPGLRKPDHQPIRVAVLGAGMVGKHAVEAATKLGSVERNNRHMEENGPGAIAITIGRNITGNEKTLEHFFRQADILVDATQRRDPSRPVVPNQWISWLPEHAVISDLAVDPYTLDSTPPVVRGVEGIPQGNLDQYVFHPDDPGWNKTIPDSIPSAEKRTVVSCYSWPGIHGEACMQHYARQLEPLMKVLVEKGYDALSPEGGYFERALFRATLKNWLQSSDS